MPKAHLSSFLHWASSSKSEMKKLVSARAAHLNHSYPTLENELESLTNEAISLTSMDDSSVRLTRVGGEQNKICLYLARDGYCHRNWITAYLHQLLLNGSRILSASTRNTVTYKQGHFARDYVTTKSKKLLSSPSMH